MIFHAIRMNFLCRNYTERKAMKNNAKHHLKYIDFVDIKRYHYYA